MSDRIVALFAGQGAQQVGMGKDLVEAFPVAREHFDRAEDILDGSRKKSHFFHFLLENTKYLKL